MLSSAMKNLDKAKISNSRKMKIYKKGNKKAHRKGINFFMWKNPRKV